MPVYVWREGHWRDKATGERAPMRDGLCTPMFVHDIAPYQSPVTGEVISGRAAKRDDLKRHNCVDAADLPSPTGGKFRTRKMVEKYRLPENLLKEQGA